ncbi:molybdopterin molybdotransferase MoeA [Plastorhodobacter daqingensis]|uniref:Molybdopterin molybdenumtransferase n=1 Tax=Plastorhodobacter daqingensis TaxID=1387281 RepID=A0ABW2UFS7_9RHOB
MISVDEALAQIFALLAPLGAETVPLAQAAGRVLAHPVRAARAQPPFPAASMDGYALAGDPRPGAVFHIVGEAAAGRAFGGSLAPGTAVRILTGAPVPEGATRVVMQEDVHLQGDRIVLAARLDGRTHIRPAGVDFGIGAEVAAPRRLRPADLALLAAMNIAEVSVTRRPDVALIATGDELVMPGEIPRDDQIIASNIFALRAMIEAEGGRARVLPIARDTAPALRMAFDLAEGADLIVTIGGASVGDHDLVARIGEELGLRRAFYKIAMRPGKPLIAGTLNGVPMLGLPGNPISAIVCGHLFLLPALRALLGLGCHPAAMQTGRLAGPVGPNGQRAHYMRARLTDAGIAPMDQQDSSLLSVFAQADALLLRPAGDGARAPGELVEYLPI